jgi:hypothetical protein
MISPYAEWDGDNRHVAGRSIASARSAGGSSITDQSRRNGALMHPIAAKPPPDWKHR